jgi:hypothetical protein
MNMKKMYILSSKNYRKKGYVQNWTIAFCTIFLNNMQKKNGVIKF